MADPLSPYPFPSNVHVLSSVTLKLSDSNYLLWKTQFESLLSSQKLVGFVNGSIAAPPTTHTVVVGGVPTLEPNPMLTRGSVLTSWSDLGYLVPCLRKSSAWFTISRRPVRELKSICDALAAIGKPVEEELKIFGFLNGLGKEYDPVSSGIQRDLSKPNPPSYNDVVTEIQAYDIKLQAYAAAEASNTHLAFNTEQPQYNGSYKQGPQNNNQNYRGGRGRYGQRGGRGGYTSRGRGFSQHQTNPNPSGERPVCQICGRTGHTAAKCYNRFDNNYQGQDPAQVFSTLQSSDVTGKEWYPDSDASTHVTASQENLQTSTPYEGNDTIMVADGAFLPITHVGSTNITSATGNLPLKDVLVCPEIRKSLLSQREPRVKGLYTLENQRLEVLYSNRQCAATEDMWHHRLGHSNIKVLQQLQSSKEISINKSRTKLICEPCQMGKCSRLQFFPSLSSRVLGPLDKVHCDLWGPSPIVSNLEFKYYAVFIDDFSRFSWFYPLRAKSEFFSVFTAFQKLVENQFGTKIKVFQSDGGGEFVNKELKQHLLNCGISHLLSCPYTPQQNGLAERKHRHVVELGLSMLFHSNTPLSY
ncbi:unnamed protein product [Microthlaspi erraticum]|uniref:Integrase catalytic domain-containing protein n=1 Tax=Microthlaspi erraticum TaxID=1685480 RepID=A0A6D2KK47_9BRAS|nr:unnamed protein product [Microthlaspi erraticum]